MGEEEGLRRDGGERAREGKVDLEASLASLMESTKEKQPGKGEQ